MMNEAQHYMRQLLQLWILSIAAVFSTSAGALMLGEIQVNSHLGQPLIARIALIDLGKTEALQLKTNLAGVEEYKALGLQYPDGNKFRFQLVNEPGTQPFIRVSTAHPVDDPFVNLLIEITQDSGKLLKAYTFLLDPSPDTLFAADESSAPSQGALPQSNHTAAFDKATGGKSEKPFNSNLKSKKHHRSAKAGQPAQAEITVQEHKSRMKLAMSLSISKSDTSAPVSPKDANDALQEEMISKEKLLADMNVQIGEMRGVIKALQNKLEPQVNELQANQEAAAPVASEAVASETVARETVVESREPKIAVSAIPPPGKLQADNKAAIDWLNSVLALIVLLLGVLGFVWYRKYKQMHQGQRGAFDDLEESSDVAAQIPVFKVPVAEPVPVKLIEAPAAASLQGEKPPVSLETAPAAEPVSTPPVIEKADLAFDVKSYETPVVVEKTSVPIVPPEYAILLEANRYLRSGQDKLAEDALIRAIQVNPKNPYGYHALLKIYGARKDATSFENIARQLKETGDEAAFNEAAEMGRQLDPDNPLYI
jgi:pilus assembly protein FimV